MSMVLSIPEQSGKLASAVETDPQRTDLWLQHLPVLNATDSLKQVHKALFDINRIPLKSKQRLALLELYRRPIQVITLEFERQIANAGFPLPEDAMELAKQIRDTQFELAHGYKAVVMDLIEKWRSQSTNANLALSLHRAIRSLSETNIKSAYYHAQPPEDLWREMHQLALFSIKLKVFRKKVKDKSNRILPKTTIAHVYKQAVLMGCLDTNRQPIRVIINAFHYLERWADNATLTKVEKYKNSRCLFYIDPRDDRPYHPAINQETIDQHCILLNARNIGKRLHYHWLSLKNGVKPSLDGLDADFFSDDADFVLKSMAQAWSGRRKRRFARKPVSMKNSCEICVGVASINHHVNEKLPFKFHKPVKKHHTVITAGTFGLQQKKRTAQTYISTKCSIEDQSAGGLQISFPQGSTLRFFVGSLTAIRTSKESNAWLIGTVCWTRYSSQDTLHMGIRLLAPQAKAAMIKPVSIDDSDDIPFVPCLLLAATPENGQPKTLIAPTGDFNIDENLQLDSSDQMQRIRTIKQIEQNKRFDWFEYNQLDI